jgi:hypothetical protein
MRSKKPWQEEVYAPQEAKTFQHVLNEFILREFPRLGGPWVVGHFVDKLLALLDEHYLLRDRIQPGQTVRMAVAVDETPGYGKRMSKTRQVSVVLTLVNQTDIAALRKGVGRRQVLRQAIARVAREAYAQGGVLTQVDLGLPFARGRTAIRYIIDQREKETKEVVPRRGTVHDMGRAPTHKRIICYKALVEGKPTHIIARETCHTPFAVDHYLLDFARVFFATHQRSLSPEETAFTLGRSLSLVKTYLALIKEFGLYEIQIADRVPTELLKSSDQEIHPKSVM